MSTSTARGNRRQLLFSLVRLAATSPCVLPFLLPLLLRSVRQMDFCKPWAPCQAAAYTVRCADASGVQPKCAWIQRQRARPASVLKIVVDILVITFCSRMHLYIYTHICASYGRGMKVENLQKWKRDNRKRGTSVQTPSQGSEET